MDLAVSLCDEIVILNNGVLEEIDKTNLTESGLKERVIGILKGEDNV